MDAGPTRARFDPIRHVDGGHRFRRRQEGLVLVRWRSYRRSAITTSRSRRERRRYREGSWYFRRL